MKTIGLEHATLELCIKDARRERVVLTRKGKPVALVVGVEGMDEEQLQLGSSDKFWTLIKKRRRQRTIGRAELEKKLARTNGGLEKPREREKRRYDDDLRPTNLLPADKLIAKSFPSRFGTGKGEGKTPWTKKSLGELFARCSWRFPFQLGRSSQRRFFG